MDNFLGTIVFLLPGVMAYFWLQAFGINPVSKHSPTEFTAVAGLLWLPVSFVTLILYNLGNRIIYYITQVKQLGISFSIIQVKPIWTMQDLRDASSSLTFLVVFLLLSAIVSYILGFLWAKWGFKLQQKMVNLVRVKRGAAPFSDNTSVWDEVFCQNEAQVVQIGRIDKPDNVTVIGEITKASRTFEAERLCIDQVEFMTKLVEKYNVPIDKAYIDIKSALYIKVYDLQGIRDAWDKEDAIASVDSSAEKKA